MNTHTILLLNTATTLFMTGLIWFVQIVHYPLFDHVGREQFARYEQSHTASTTLVVAPVMLLEALAAFLLLLSQPRPSTLAAFLLLLLIWLSTALLQVPKHNLLSAGFDPAAHAALVSSNWLRTLAWTLRSALTLYWLASPRPPSGSVP
jgi:hypothetical protein